jgi:hypothetical protein
MQIKKLSRAMAASFTILPNVVSQVLPPVPLNKEVLLLSKWRLCNDTTVGNNVGGVLHYNRL